MADYKFTGDGGVIRYSDSANIPNASGNRDWQEYLQYVTGGGLTDGYTKDEAFLQVIEDINTKCKEENLKDFQYNKGGRGDLTYNYVADLENIQAVAVETFSCPVDDPIPVPNGVWKTNDTEVDGVTPIYVAFKCSEFQLFKTSFYTRGSNNFGIKEIHKNAIKTLYLNPTKTAEDIKAYDYTQGWN